eukprot:GHVQ01023715.1.p1 GENE.GHVQ01023715.1~~GHVQ01023715.1.p1  ORF type:complete len:526 (+),score=61.03 GHVQ01023715.1:271-1848(+)
MLQSNPATSWPVYPGQPYFNQPSQLQMSMTQSPYVLMRRAGGEVVAVPSSQFQMYQQQYSMPVTTPPVGNQNSATAGATQTQSSTHQPPHAKSKPSTATPSNQPSDQVRSSNRSPAHRLPTGRRDIPSTGTAVATSANTTTEVSAVLATASVASRGVTEGPPAPATERPTRATPNDSSNGSGEARIRATRTTRDHAGSTDQRELPCACIEDDACCGREAREVQHTEGDSDGEPRTSSLARVAGWDLATVKSHSSQRWHDAQRRLDKVKELLIHLEKAMECEFLDNDTYSSSVDEAHTIHQEVNTTLEKCSTYISTRLEQLDECNVNYKLLIAESLPDCSNTSLDEISDALSAGLQAATIALSRRQTDNKEIRPPQPNFEFYFKTMPEPNFDPPAKAGMSERSGQSEPLCSQLIEQLQELRTLQAQGYEDLQKKDLQLKDLQGKITEKNDHYGRERHALEKLEHKLDNRIRQVNRLSGKDSYSDMTPELLSDLCRQINKASRRIATEQALREIRAASNNQTELFSY